MRIIHFSDFHLRPNSGLGRSQQLLDKMLEALDIVNATKPIDFIIFSGDMIDRGGADFTSPEVAFGNFKNLILDKITARYSLAPEKFVFVPGNHDIQRSLDKSFIETGLESTLIDVKAVDDFIHDSSNLDCINRIKSFNT